jgi:hypothetical protein
MNLDAKLSLGLSQLGHAVYNFSQRDVARAENPFKSKNFGRKAMIKALLETVKNFRPELVVLGHSEMVDDETLKELRNHLPDAPFVMWYCDPLFREYEDVFDVPLLSRRSELIDVIFTTSGANVLDEITKGRCIAAHVPNWVHAGCESGKAFASANLNNDLIYAGNDYNLAGRKALLESLVGSSSSLNFALYQALGNPRIHGQAYYDQLSSSLMGLSLSRRFDVPWYTSDRMQQEMGNGVCTISPSTEGLTQLFSSDEVVWFDNEDEILEKVNWYKAHESEARTIAERGWKAVHERCDALRVAQFMIDLAFDQPLSEDYEWSSQIIKRY